MNTQPTCSDQVIQLLSTPGGLVLPDRVVTKLISLSYELDFELSNILSTAEWQDIMQARSGLKHMVELLCRVGEGCVLQVRNRQGDMFTTSSR